MEDFKEGDYVICNGFRGRVFKICDDDLTGMVEIQLKRGFVCVAKSELQFDEDYDNEV